MLKDSCDLTTRSNIPLVLDLDGTVVYADLLYEAVLQLLSESPQKILKIPYWLMLGKAKLKARIADEVQIEVESLRYVDECLHLIELARIERRPIILCSSANHHYVERIANYLGLFDETHGSTEETNLNGDRKAALLVKRFGRFGFDYAGDRIVDLPVWENARRVITVNASGRLRHKVDALFEDPMHISPSDNWIGKLKSRIRAVRPHQWLKNLLLFLPLLTAHQFDSASLIAAAGAFVVFSLAASSAYVLNDLLDLAFDRQHPRKRMRPFAANELPIADGLLMCPILLFTALLTAGIFLPPMFFITVALYYFLTVAYSLVLKRVLIIDVFTLAGLYSLRVLAGGFVIEVIPSPWLLAFSVFFFLSLAAIKRQAELTSRANGDEDAVTGRAYMLTDLPIVQNMATSAGYVAALVMALYVSSLKVAALYSTPAVLWLLCPLLLYWISHMIMKTHQGQMHDDPVVFAITDKMSWVVGVLALATIGLGSWL